MSNYFYDGIIDAMTIQNPRGFNEPQTAWAIVDTLADKSPKYLSVSQMTNLYKDVAHAQRLGLLKEASKNILGALEFRISRDYLIDHPEVVSPEVYRQIVS